jgi:hypothetical protein
MAGRQRIADQGETRIGDAGHAGIGDQGNVALLQAFDEASATGGGRELVEAGQGRVNIVGAKQGAGHAGVLGGHQWHGLQDAQRAQGDVFQVANRGGHHVQRPHVASLLVFGIF